MATKSTNSTTPKTTKSTSKSTTTKSKTTKSTSSTSSTTNTTKTTLLSQKDLIRELSLAMDSAYGRKPTDVSGIENISNTYYFAYLLRLLKGLFELKCPDYWDKDFILDTLLLNGVFGVFEANSEPIAMNCQPYGVNMYYKPTNFIIANPVLGNFDKRIGVDGALVYLEEVPLHNAEFRTQVPLLTLYAYKLAACDKAIDQSLMNSSVVAIFSAADKKSAESFKKMYDEMQTGQPAVFVDESLGLASSTSRNLTYTPAKDNYVCDIIQIEKRNIIEEFLTAIGVKNANTSKRERLNSDEVNSNNSECFVSVETWRRNLKDCVDHVHSIFPSLEFDLTIKDLSIIDILGGPASGDKVGEDNEREEGESDDTT